jgi:hypothetical protein
MPPTKLHRTDAPTALRFYAERYSSGATKRWDLAAHLMEQAADIIEASKLRPAYEQIIDLVDDCQARRTAAGESNRMMAKWISEGLNALVTIAP